MEAAMCWCCSECPRDFQKTLSAAGSTLFLLIAANWQLGILSGIGEPSVFVKRCRAMLLRTVFAIMLSFFTLTISFIDVYSVLWLCREGVFEPYEEGLISVAAIMGTCPILIAIPPPQYWQGSQWNIHNEEQLAQRIGGTFTYKLNEGLHALPLSPRPQQQQHPTTANAHHIDQQQPATLLTTSIELALDAPYIVLSPLFVGRYSTRARSLLLQLKLVPKYQELCLLRSRSRFQNLVTLFQVAGYMVGVVLRMGECRGISPLEAILGLLCIQVLLQLVMASFACSHYQRPLLLHLHPFQFSRLLEKSAHTAQRGLNVPLAMISKRFVRSSIIYSGLALTLILLPAPLVYYALFIRRYCHLCFISTLFMAFLPLLSFLSLGALVWCGGWKLVMSRPRVIEKWPPPHHSLGLPWLKKGGLSIFIGLIIIALLYFTGIFLAGLATYRHWRLFENPTSHAWISSILPHVSDSS